MTKITIKTFKKALENSGGNQSIIAQKIGVTRGAINIYLGKHPKMKALLEIESERIIDVAENILDSKITKDRDIDAAKWKLTNSKRGKSRGYGIKQEIEIAGSINQLTKEERTAEIKRLLKK